MKIILNNARPSVLRYFGWLLCEYPDMALYLAWSWICRENLGWVHELCVILRHLFWIQRCQCSHMEKLLLKTLGYSSQWSGFPNRITTRMWVEFDTQAAVEHCGHSKMSILSKTVELNWDTHRRPNPHLVSFYWNSMRSWVTSNFIAHFPNVLIPWYY